MILWYLAAVFFIFNHWFHGFGASAVFGTAIVVAFGAASHYLVERPMLRFK